MAKLSEIHGDPPRENCRSAREMFLDSVAKYPGNLALACVHQPHDLYNTISQPLDDDDYREKPYLRWTFKDLEAGIQRCITGLKAVGVKPGMPVFSFNTNGVEHLLVFWATTEIGCVFVPINPRNLTNKEEVKHMVKTARSVVPGKNSLVVASSPDLITPLEDLALFQDSIKIVVSTDQPNQGWIHFETLMSETSSNGTVENNIDEADKVIDGTVMFTSGTTSLPKGCFRKYPDFNFIYENHLEIRAQDYMIAGDAICGVLPNNHALGHFWLLFTHTVGAGMVFPGPAFQTDIILKTLQREKINHMVLVPTMMHALIGLKASLGQKLDHLKSVTFGGAVLTPGNLKSCINELGTKGVENGFGMTEGLIVRTLSHRDPSKIIDGEEVSVGWVLPGVSIRVADPDTNKVVPRNTLGELQGSASSIKHYIGGVGKDSFYHDPDGRMWFKSGDQARIDDQGRLFITGRYKEMIIRGGENISPIAIEAVISKSPGLSKLMPQVVAAPDPIAGEVPVAIVLGQVDADIREAVQKAVLTQMGTVYVPEDVISVHDLGLKDYPRTMAGKIQKVKLAALVKKHKAEKDAASLFSDEFGLASDVKNIWAIAVGIEPSRLSLDTQISEFADSITVMRVRDTVRRKTGKNLSLVEMATAKTISGHIKLLKKRSFVDEKNKESKRVIRDGPPRIEDMAHLTEDPEYYEATKHLVLKAISPYGLNWEDVEDVIPAYDFNNVLIEKGIMQSWGFKFAILSKKAVKHQLRQALEAMFKNNRILTSFLVYDEKALGTDDALHILTRQNKKFFDIVFEDGGKVQTVDQLRAKSLDYRGQVTYPGPLARAVLYDIKETDTAGVVLCLDHSVIDASTGLIFSADLEKALSSTAPLLEHVDYKLWADSYFNQRLSAEARAATKWHVKRLKDLEIHRRALWPPFIMPKKANEYIVENTGEDAVYHDFDDPAIYDFRKSYPQISAAAVVKAALALLTVSKTGYTHALFGNLEAARTMFPFLPRALEVLGQFEATDVSGPTIQQVTNLIEFRPNETVLALLERLQEEQTNLTKYAPAPLREIMTSLGGAGDMIPEVLGHHMFNWTPGMGANGTNPHQQFEMLNAIVRVRHGLSWNAGLGGPHGKTFFIAVRSITFNQEEQKQLALELEKITRWLLAKDNWNSAASGFTEALK